MHSVVHDLRLTIRHLARHRTFTAIVLATLALGIGATSTFFSILNGVALRPLPFENPDQLVAIERVARSGAVRSRIASTQVATVREAAGLSSAVAYVTRPVTISGSGAAEQVTGAEVSGDLFALLGVLLQRGVSRLDGDGAPAAVISHDVWTHRFASDPAAVGSIVSIDGTAHTVVGIAAAGFGL